MNAAGNAATAAERIECSKCHRPLTSAASRAAGIGPRCSAVNAATEGLSPKQVDKMEQLLADEAIVKTNRKSVYNIVNEAGEVIHITHLNGHCTCEWSQRRMTADVKICYHVAAARLMAKPLIRKPAPVPAPAAPVALPAPAALWAEMDRWNDACMAMA